MAGPKAKPDAPAGAFEGEYGFSLGRLFQVIRKRLWVISLMAVVLTCVVVGLSLQQTPKYEASIKILVGQGQESEAPVGSLGGEVQGLQQITQTMVEGINTLPVVEAVIQQLGLQTPLEDFQKNLNVEQVRATQFIQVDYTDTSPVRAQRVANAVGDAFSEQVSEVNPSANAITATVWERARLPDQPVSPKPVRNGLLALALGVMLGIALAFLLDYLDDSWRSPEEVEQISGLPTFGVIPKYEDPKAKTNIAKRLVTVLEPNSVAAEAYRTLRTNLLYGVVDAPPKVVVITSSNTREGKSNTCANLAVTLAQTGKYTLIIDCDFHKPDLHSYFGLRNLQGIVDVLAGQRSLQEVWEEPVEGLKVVPVGPIPPNPTQILDSRRFAEFLAGVREEFDYVLLDTPPLGAVSDAAILATKGDGVLLVLDAQNTRKVFVRRSIRNLQSVGANILGTVINNVKDSKTHYYSYAQSHD